MSRYDSDAWHEMQRDAADSGPDIVDLQSKDRTARKAHICDGCRVREIKPGERYRYQAWIEDGEFRQMRTCLGFFHHYGEACVSAQPPSLLI